MDGDAYRPLSTDEAKVRLLEVSHDAGVVSWIRRNPGNAVTYAVIGGLILGSTPSLRRSISRMAIAAAPILLSRLRS